MVGFREFLESWLPPAPARVLEVGAGRGELAAHLRDRGYDVVAIDPHAGGGTDVLPVAVEAVDATLGSFDAAVAQSSLHHVADADAAVASIAAVLRPGAILAVQDFGWDLIDEATAAWVHAEGRRLGREPFRVPFTVWFRRFRADHDGLLRFAQVRAALTGGFDERWFEWVSYLADEYLDADPEARRSEETLAARGEIRSVAFRYVGTRPEGDAADDPTR